MAETASIIDENVERLQDTFKNIEGEFKKLQDNVREQSKKVTDNVREQSKKVTDEIEAKRKEVEKKTQAEWDKIKETPIGKRADDLGKKVSEINEKTTSKAEDIRKETEKKLENSFESILGAFQIASKSDLAKIDKKLNAISRKIKALEGGGKATKAAAKKD